jgi:putative membrane protein insertion efficiency factor
MIHRIVNYSKLIFIFFFIIGSVLHAGDTDIGERNLTPLKEKTKDQTNSAPYPILLYQKYISPVIGDRCPMYPSCSHYSTEALRKNGTIMGIIMTCDRLIRCGRDETKQSPAVFVDSEKYIYDPVDNNDFWHSR